MASSEVIEYAWPSTVGVANFVTVKPGLENDERTNFKIWKKQMLCLLESQEVAGFVNGEIPPPPEHEEQKKIMWRRTDMLVQGWILGSIGKDALDVVWDKPTAREIWVELDKIFEEEEEEEEEEKAKEEIGETEEIEEEEAAATIRNEDFRRYSRLYQAAILGDWNAAKNFFPDINQLCTTVISSKSETALHIAVMTGNLNIDFVKKLVELMPPEALALRDSEGDTALQSAAFIGNTEAVKAMVKKNRNLLYTSSDGIRGLPILRAISRSHKETVEYLTPEYELPVQDEPLFFERQGGIVVLNAIIACGFVDIALHLARKYPILAILMDLHSRDRRFALSTISQTHQLFPRTEAFSWWQKFIYHRIPLKKSEYEVDLISVGHDIESLGSHGATHKNYSTSFQVISKVRLKVESMIWHVIENLVPKAKELREKKATHQRALQLANYLCNKIVALPENKALIIFHESIILAAKNGISEIVEMIIQKCPYAVYCRDVDQKSVFMLAATYRFENVFNLIYNMSDRKYAFHDSEDEKENNLMHICGKLAPPNRLNLVAGAALQMQRELQWFKEMENFVSPSRRTRTNDQNQTPGEIFTEEHKKLKADGERWMKDTANACTIAAALIATVMFAAAFTVPGGLESSTGIPLLLGQSPFMLFAISDAISLFASITSLLMFLSILTSRYAEEDFLYVLPKRLSVGLLSLFISIAFMMVAFGATLYLIFRRKATWFLVLLVAFFAFFPITSFVLLQFPLLVDVVYSTYGPGIFGKKSNRLLYSPNFQQYEEAYM